MKNFLICIIGVLVALLFAPGLAIAQESGGLDTIELIAAIIALVANNTGSAGLILLTVIGIAAPLSAMLPNGSKNPILAGFLRVLNLVAANVGTSKNDPKAP